MNRGIHERSEYQPRCAAAYPRLESLNDTGIGPVTRSGTKGAEIYFNDPDGNHLEVHCSKVPESQRGKYHVGPYDKSLCVHKQDWPPKELAAEAERLFQASLARMRQRRNPH